MPNRFEFIKSNASSVDKIKLARAKFEELAEFVSTLAPECREMSVAMTNLETSAFWVNRAICVSQTEEAGA